MFVLSMEENRYMYIYGFSINMLSPILWGGGGGEALEYLRPGEVIGSIRTLYFSLHRPVTTQRER